MAKTAKTLLAASPALVALLCAAAAPGDGGKVLDERGVCCVEPAAYFIARAIGDLAPFAVALSLVCVVIIWRGSRPG